MKPIGTLLSKAVGAVGGGGLVGLTGNRENRTDRQEERYASPVRRAVS